TLTYRRDNQCHWRKHEGETFVTGWYIHLDEVNDKVNKLSKKADDLGAQAARWRRTIPISLSLNLAGQSQMPGQARDGCLESIERQFNFELPLGMYPNVVERVRGTPARLEDLTRGMSREVLTRRDGDKWSIQEQAGHLLDLEELGMQRLADFEA